MSSLHSSWLRATILYQFLVKPGVSRSIAASCAYSKIFTWLAGKLTATVDDGKGRRPDLLHSKVFATIAAICFNSYSKFFSARHILCNDPTRTFPVEIQSLQCLQIESALDESTAELGKLEFAPLLSTIEASFKLKKAVPLHTSLRISCKVYF